MLTRCEGLPLFAAALAIGLSAGCSRENRVEAGAKERVVYFANDTEPADLDPNTCIDSAEENALNALFEGLVGLSNDGSTILPGVADRWEISADGLVYTFHLRADARWSNGAPVTSDDFVFSFRRVFDPLVACEESSFGFAIRGGEDIALGRVADLSSLGVSGPDPRTFVVQLAHPAPYFLGMLAKGSPFMPVYRPSLEKFGGVHQRGAPWTREGNLVCNGPFVLTRWVQNQVMELRKNPHYWDAARVKLAGINIYPVEDASVQERGFRAREFHMTTKFPIYKESAYAGEQPQVLRRIPLLRTNFITFNVAKAPFADARIRRAFSMAIDRVRLCSAVFHSFAEPAFAQVRPGTGGYTAKDADTDRFDPGTARRLMEEAGYPGGRGFPQVELMLVGNDPQTVNMGEVVQSAWRDGLGVVATLAPTEKKVYLDAERSKNYQLMIEQWDYPWNDPTAYYQTAYSGNPNNDSGWSDPEFDRAFRASELSADSQVRNRAFDTMEARLGAGVPYAPLFYWNKPVLVLPSVKGWEGNALDHIEWKEISLAQ